MNKQLVNTRNKSFRGLAFDFAHVCRAPSLAVCTTRMCASHGHARNGPRRGLRAPRITLAGETSCARDSPEDLAQSGGPEWRVAGLLHHVS